MSIRILHIIPRLQKGGAERLCLDICNELQKRDGIRVRLITFSDANAYPFLTKKIDWQIIPASVNLSIVHKNQYNTEILQKAIEAFAPDVIHTHLFEAEIVSRSCYYPKAKWFSHCHDNMKQFRNLNIKTLFHKELFTNYYEKRYLIGRYKVNDGNTFIAISKDTKQYFDGVVSRFEVVLLKNAIDYQRFYKLKSYESQNNILHLIHVGSFNTNKNQKFLIDVAKQLQKRKFPFELHFLGDGELRKKMETSVLEKRLQNLIFFHGNVDNVEEYLWNSDIYVHSSFSEALGLTIVEAMATGLPVVTLDGGGNRDLIEEGKNGYMIYEQNPKLYAEKILKIWNDKQKYQEMSMYAQEYAKQYDIVQYVDNLLKVYNEK